MLEGLRIPRSSPSAFYGSSSPPRRLPTRPTLVGLAIRAASQAWCVKVHVPPVETRRRRPKLSIAEFRLAPEILHVANDSIIRRAEPIVQVSRKYLDTENSPIEGSNEPSVEASPGFSCRRVFSEPGDRYGAARDMGRTDRETTREKAAARPPAGRGAEEKEEGRGKTAGMVFGRHRRALRFSSFVRERAGLHSRDLNET